MSKLTFVFSGMNSGKSLHLLTKNFMLKDKGFVTMLMKPELDQRDSLITSRLGLEEKCITIAADDLPSKQIFDSIQQGHSKPDYVLVDEAQFLSEKQVWDLSAVVDHLDIDVICFGLKLNWRGSFFTGSEALFKVADDLQQLESFCKQNKGAPALFHIKNGGSDDDIEAGYEALYDTVSRKVWKQWFDTHRRNQAAANMAPTV